jgi:hypothetical protein
MLKARIAMPPTKCIACGGDDLYQAQRMSLFGNLSHWVIIRIALGRGADVKCSVCLSCGFVSPYLDDAALKSFRKAKSEQNAKTPKTAGPAGTPS